MISTSPSLYLQVLGTAAASDQCSTVGPVLTSPIITLAPGDLSTWGTLPNALYYGLGQTWGFDLLNEYMFGTFAPLNVQDLACPTWSATTIRPGVLPGR